ncbi:DEKNAAC105418 [Brettanomyces naardenensis]|uniref:DEKNAAC105418 n=1 Tax=Brettanomyces naardenensis TaxID=13370 RepID=A0A448YTI3_BRENA|nr:DEKNAAC105418 [Brettanomyces naardenensis]
MSIFFGNIDGIDSNSLFIFRISSILLLHYIATYLAPQFAVVSLFLTSLFGAVTVRNTEMFQSLVRVFRRRLVAANEPETSRKDLLLSIYDISQYLQKSRKWNDRKRAKFRRMPTKHQHICNGIGYPEKLALTDTLLARNNVTTQRVYREAMNRYNVTPTELKQASRYATSIGHSEHFRVVESLCHLVRDWSSNDDSEVSPMLDYIRKHSNDLSRENTTVIVPGSGLGRVAHEVALMGFKGVHAVEFSWLMGLFNESMYGEGKIETGTIYPYLHNYSNHFRTKDQMRSVSFSHGFRKPDNLVIHKEDFTKFEVEQETKDVLIVTCFFIDTAEDMLEYFDAITRICDGYEGKKRWINVGPLKYGTAPKVELSNDEVGKVREAMGWRRIDEVGKPVRVGYMTDKEGMWQGYYGVSMWVAERGGAKSRRT